jgi:hypothetical protein
MHPNETRGRLLVSRFYLACAVAVLAYLVIVGVGA